MRESARAHLDSSKSNFVGFFFLSFLFVFGSSFVFCVFLSSCFLDSEENICRQEFFFFWFSSTDWNRIADDSNKRERATLNVPVYIYSQSKK
jgi:hypothetical protein